MSKYRKKPIIIEANQWVRNGDHPKDNSFYINDPNTNEKFLSEGEIVRRYRGPHMKGHEDCKHCGKKLYIHGFIETLEGGHIVCPYDFIIEGVHGEFYPCKPDIFEKTYEKL